MASALPLNARRAAALGVAALIASCGGRSRDERGAPASSRPAEVPGVGSLSARLPEARGDRSPGELAGGNGRGDELSDVEVCAACHEGVVSQLATSAHAAASFDNPIYRAAVEVLRRDVSKSASRMCAGCHDPALLVDDRMDHPVDPRDRRALAGVRCRVCHESRGVTRDGNGSLQLADRAMPLPVGADPESIERHRSSARVTTGAELCGSCHRSFLHPETGNPDLLVGMDELGSWQASAYAGQGAGQVDAVEEADCIGCHMGRESVVSDAAAKDGTVASHRFLGGHTYLAAMRGDTEDLKRRQAFLRGIVEIDVAAARVEGEWVQPAELARPAPGGELLFDVVLFNRAVGHSFPGGVGDAQNSWLDVEVVDAAGTVIASSMGDHVLTAWVADPAGQLQRTRATHRFSAKVVDSRIPPRGAVAIRYRARLPERLRTPITVRAALRHKSRAEEVRALGCAERRSPRGRAYDRALRDADREALDACVEQPVTVVDTAAIELGSRSSRRPADAERLYRLGMALGDGLQERAGEALPALEAARQLWRGDPREARALVRMAAVLGRIGRIDEALDTLARAEELAPKAASVYAVRGAALARVWRWDQAAAAYGEAAARAPKNAVIASQLAMARGSAGDHEGALAAAQAALDLRPRDADALRVQALALRALGADEALVDESLESYAAHRGPDGAHDVRLACAAKSEACARERVPVHVHDMR